MREKENTGIAYVNHLACLRYFITPNFTLVLTVSLCGRYYHPLILRGNWDAERRQGPKLLAERMKEEEGDSRDTSDWKPP